MSRPEAAWNDYRKRRATLFVLLAGFLPAGVCAALLSKAFMGSDKFVIPVALCWLAAYAIAGNRLARFPCPRCRLPFFYSQSCYAPWAGQCMHCSWLKWREFDPSRDPPAKLAGDEDETSQCLSCGGQMPIDADTCPACGWSYLDDAADNRPADRRGESGAP